MSNKKLQKQKLKKTSSTSSTTPFINPRSEPEPDMDIVWADLGLMPPSRKKRSLLYDVEGQKPFPTLEEIKNMTDPKEQKKMLKKWKKKKKKREEDQEREDIVWDKYAYCNYLDNPFIEILIFFLAIGTVATLIAYLHFIS